MFVWLFINFLIGYTKGHACYITQVVSRFVSMFSCACHGITPFFPALAPEYVLTGVSTHTFSRACNRLHLTHRCHACHRGHVFCLSCDWFFEFRFNDWFKLEYQPLFGKISSRSFSLSSRRRTFLRQDGAIRSCDWFSLTVTLLFLLSVVTSWPRSSLTS